jgi:hypothetical protein
MSKKDLKLSHTSGSKTTKSSSSSHSTPKPPGFRLKKPLFEMTEGAPAAVSTPFTRSLCELSGDLYQGIRMKVRTPWLDVAAPAAFTGITNTVPCLLGQGTYDGSSIGLAFPNVVGISPWRMPMYTAITSSQWSQGLVVPNSAVPTNISESFSKYKYVGGLTLHYLPISTTTNGFSVTIAGSTDPAHPYLGLCGRETPFPTKAILENTSACVTFATWLPWSAEFPLSKEEFYMYQEPAYAPDTSTVTWDRAECRESLAGVIGAVLYGPAATGTIQVFGTLFAEYTVQLIDPSPVTALAVPDSLNRSHMRRTLLMSRRSSEEKEEKRVVRISEELSDGEVVDLPLSPPKLVRTSRRDDVVSSAPALPVLKRAV